MFPRNLWDHGRQFYRVVLLCLLAALLYGCPGKPPRSPSISPVIRASRPLASAPLPSPLAFWKPRLGVLSFASTAPNLVALTFDAGSSADAVPLILKTLVDHNVHATFFLTGKFCQHYPVACRAIANAGMEIGNHSYSHPHFTKLESQAIKDQISKAAEVIRNTCGRPATTLFRFPYGDDDIRTCKVVAADGYQAVGWTLDSLDSVGKPKPAAFVIARIDKKIRPGYITLMHVSCVESAKALPAIFAHLDKMGWKVVPISELLRTVAARRFKGVVSCSRAAQQQAPIALG